MKKEKKASKSDERTIETVLFEEDWKLNDDDEDVAEAGLAVWVWNEKSEKNSSPLSIPCCFSLELLLQLKV